MDSSRLSSSDDSTRAGRTEATRIAIVILEDQMAVGQAFARAFDQSADFRVAGVTSSLCEAIDLSDAQHANVVLCDAALPDRAAYTFLTRIRAARRATIVLLLDESIYLANVREGLRLGARGYHTKEEPLATLAEAVRRVARGEHSFARDLAYGILMTPDGPRLAPAFRYMPLETLTQRELDVLLQIVQGSTVKACAEHLNLSESTVDNHKTSLMRKLNMHRTVELVRLAIRERLIPV